ncbi:MAG: hypothetical protein GQ579_04450 [Bacteroidales bacterium]|nr:hypothetical protein [Bacteroidales bacterium]
MFLLIRDTFVHPDGYLKLYFQADWTHFSPEPDKEGPERMTWFFNHFTYGHDVETAFLLLETAHVLGWGEDEITHHTAKQLVDQGKSHIWKTSYHNARGMLNCIKMLRTT